MGVGAGVGAGALGKRSGRVALYFRDDSAAIGKRYRRQDEIGTPWCVTIDHESIEQQTVTLRERDSLVQDRVAIERLGEEIVRRLAAPWQTPKLGA